MGTDPRKIENDCREEINRLLKVCFDIENGQESVYDFATRPKARPQQTTKNPDRWLCVQLKGVKRRDPSWARKIRNVLVHKQEALRDVVLLSYSLAEDTETFCHLVHRKHDYHDFDPHSSEHIFSEVAKHRRGSFFLRFGRPG